MTAESMGQAVEIDPQLVMPKRPRFLRELVTLEMGDGLLVEGTDEQQMLRGSAAKTLLPKLIPALDGTHTPEELAALHPQLPSRAIHNAIALLYTRGLLEDAAADPDGSTDAVSTETLAFMRRYVDVTRVNRSAGEAVHRLQQAQVALCITGAGSSEAQQVLSEALTSAGVGQVHAFTLGEDPCRGFDMQRSGGKRLAAVLVTDEEDTAELLRLDEACAFGSVHSPVSWLRAKIDFASHTAELGPYFERGESACYSCFQSAYGSSSRSGTPAANARTSALTQRLWADMLAAEIIYVLSRIGPMTTRSAVVRYNLIDWTSENLRVPRRPGCVHCRGEFASDTPASTTPSEPLAYEDAVAFPSRHLLDPKGHQVHYKAHSLELTQQSKRYPSAKKVALPGADKLPMPEGDALTALTASPDSTPTESLTLDRLSGLLLLAAGIEGRDGHTRSKLRRWAPTGGNLGSVELYTAVTSVEGLEPGLYFYQPQEHELALVRQDRTPAEIQQFLASAVKFGKSPGAVIITVAAHHRVAQKYGAFAYRIIHLDAGVALTQLRTCAAGLGLNLRVARHWSDTRISDELDLVRYSEVVTGAAAVYGADWRSQ